jgi:hypothetical protein
LSARKTVRIWRAQLLFSNFRSFRGLSFFLSFFISFFFLFFYFFLAWPFQARPACSVCVRGVVTRP